MYIPISDEYLNLNYFIPTGDNLLPQRQFSCRIINFEQEENGVHAIALSSYDFL